MNYWWVNQNQTQRHEVSAVDGYMWSPKRQQNGGTHFSYEFMKCVVPGDVVFSYANSEIIALGVAQTYCYSFPKPIDFGRAGIAWSNEGWKVDVKYRRLDDPIRTIDRIDELRPLLPPIYSPLKPDNGYANQAYLFKIELPMTQALAAMIDNEALALVNAENIGDLGFDIPTIDVRHKEWEDLLEQDLKADIDLPETERERIILARVGQGRFRELVMANEPRCRVTGVDKAEHLIASHIKPWRSANNEERLSGDNGLMLTPTVDHLFDKGFIGFENNGDILLADVADRAALRKMGVIDRDYPNRIAILSDTKKQYLAWHRESILLRQSVGN